MASLTGLAFQIDFLVGRGSRRNAVSAVRDTVDAINLTAREGARNAGRERKKSLEKQLAELDDLAKESSRNLVAGKEATAKAIAKRTAATAAASTRRLKADTSALDAVGKKTVSVAKMMKGAFKDLNTALASRGVEQLAGASLTGEKAMLDFASRERGEREQILAIQREINESKRAAGTITEGEIRNEKALKQLVDEINALEKKDGMTQNQIQKKKNELVKEFNEQTRNEQIELRRNIELRREQAAAIERVAMSVKDTLRNAFVYSTAAVTAFYYKLNELNQTFAAFENELINAQSIFQTNRETLFGLSDEIAKFGLSYGIELQNASTGLYQLASAGLSAEDSMSVLNDTLTLSMAVQGDHNTISKLTTQTLFGFGMEMDQSGMLVDKFAHAINKSLIEYQDLASAVKFAMPFFVSTGQSVDQLLGSLQVLTNRALEAGIAGRGLRQAMAEFAEGAEDSTREFAKLGVKVVDTEGNMLQLTEIARNFAEAFPDINDNVELMTTLLEDLNVRGATAFVHLVQNVDEFEAAVNDLQNAHGSAAEMAQIQQASIVNQMQIVKNALQMPFIMSDEVGKANGYINEFQMTLHALVAQFRDLIYVEGPQGEKVLTDVGKGIKKFVITAMKELGSLLKQGMELFKSYAREAGGTTEVLSLLTVPLRTMLSILRFIGPEGIKFIILWKTLNGILPITSIMMGILTNKTVAQAAANLLMAKTELTKEVALYRVSIASGLAMGGLGLLLAINLKFAKSSGPFIAAISAITGAFIGLSIAISMVRDASKLGFAGILAAATIGAAVGLGVFALTRTLLKPAEVNMPPVPEYDIGADMAASQSLMAGNTPTFDTGGRIPMYDTGGRPDHRMIMVEPGESVISKTQNMADGQSQGVSIVIQGDVYDSDKFAEKVARVLPNTERIMYNRGMI